MTFEFRKTADVGARHHVVARLGVQTSELVQWFPPGEDKDRILSLYLETLMQRLLDCHQFKDSLSEKLIACNSDWSTQKVDRLRLIPHVAGLVGIAESFLYASKNYLRDLLRLFEILYSCHLKDASTFADLKGKGDSDLVKWSTATFGADDQITVLLRTEQEWTAKFIRMRNAVEHPGGYSGNLIIHNIVVHPTEPGMLIPPAWELGESQHSDILNDMTVGLDNLLTLAEDLLADAVVRKAPFRNLRICQRPADERDPSCPVRLYVGMNT
ncbi:hypothetical protein [Bradyrhizobium sp. 62]|uniref:hypothetical protein n=1 Tax=Bradyrhizobium sp. 62 TaxID=1043588 RepID=UPI001FF83840|nr:hypothetical protein [Bradyrhizobium sp. 62]MCK1367797.1 hypothetical protein [Bradyrhizobium sp. 62]